MQTDDLIHIMTDRIVAKYSPVRIILFGSWARGNATPHSDVDLLIVLPEVKNKRLAAVSIRRILADLPVAKDILVTTPQEIEQKGHLVGTYLRPALKGGKS